MVFRVTACKIIETCLHFTFCSYVRSEAIAVVYICKKGGAPWSYCDVVNAKTNTDGRKKEGITFPSGITVYILGCKNDKNVSVFGKFR